MRNGLWFNTLKTSGSFTGIKGKIAWCTCVRKSVSNNKIKSLNIFSCNSSTSIDD